LYTVRSGFPDIVLDTPSPSKAPAIDSSTRIPFFRQPRHLSLKYPYLLFIPKHFAWRHTFFKVFNYSRDNLPIVKDDDGRFYLDENLAKQWLDMEICLRALGREMIELAPMQRWLGKTVSAWFFPGRFKFLNKFHTEEAARTAAWYSIDNFLPLVAYVTMGFWIMHCVEGEAQLTNVEPPDWRHQVLAKVNVHPSYLSYLEDSISWEVERVGALYCIQAPLDSGSKAYYSEEGEQRADIEEFLATIIHTNVPIPIYLSWGNLPREINLYDVPKAFHHLVPSKKELEYLASKNGELKFSRWAVNEDLNWESDPYTPPVAATPIPSEESTPAVPAAPFPSRPAHSKQKADETIQAFFSRRREANLKKIANESTVDRQRRLQRADNAKKGGVAKKAHIFVWEQKDGHYIREPVTRAEVEDYLSDYPGPERRYDPFHNEWDLCHLFGDNDPVFGDGFDDVFSDDDDDDDDGMHPIFPQDVDMASRLPQDDNDIQMQVPEVQHPEVPEVVQMQHPHNPEIAPIEDGPWYDIGPDFRESDIPMLDLKAASTRCVNLVYLKFGLAPRTETIEYESIAGNLLDALNRRFGFVMPASPPSFVPRDPPQESLDPKLLANVIGMTDIANELASEKGFQHVLCTFFGQCMVARSSVNHIDKNLLDYHRPGFFPRPPSPFEIGREYLTSMRNPAERSWYYVLRRIGSGIGSEVLLIPQATDLLEVLRQQWGPDIKDVVRHFLARGIQFWLAYISVEIMPESQRVVPGLRPKGFKTDTTSGLGFRPCGYEFDSHDYNAYTTQRDLQLLHTPRGRIALQYGGVIARLARSEISDEDFFRGFDEEIYIVGDCLWDRTSEHAYWHDRLSDREIDLLCGVYHLATGM
jgi:hypothetical protein